MKKVIALFGVMLFSASAFALNAVAQGDEDCASRKEAFEQYAAEQKVSFIEQNILMNMADPMVGMSDEQALPLAACYATFEVKGVPFVKFVRANAGIFPGDINGKEKTELLNFADRVERLSEQANINRVADGNNSSFIMQYILLNFADKIADLEDAQAEPLAKVYKACNVNGKPMLQYVKEHSNEFYSGVKAEFDTFVNRVEQLTK
ncbi:MAG: hypothetical protein J6Y17_04235 [Elusimicrobiaceae bacterium]|nr:hypothetical protein [Elusimicrobiaceae bacterium]